MGFCVFLTIALVITCNAGSVQLTEKLFLEWTFAVADKIQFTYTVDNSLKEDYGWVGVGLQKPGTSGMTDSDIVNIIFGSDGVDSWAKSSSRPEADTSLTDGAENLENFTTTEGDTSVVFTWERALVTGDEWDHEIQEGQEFSIIYAWGKVDDNGKQLQHLTGNRGKKVVELSESTSALFLNFLAH